MARQHVAPVGSPSGADPIARIARAEREAFVRGPTDRVVPADTPEVQPPTRPLAPVGLARTVDRALGRIALPTLLELTDALEDAAAVLSDEPRLEPALRDVIDAVLADERRKVLRYVDLRDA